MPDFLRDARELIEQRTSRRSEMTVEQMALLNALADAAKAGVTDVMDAADLLICAAVSILADSYAPAVARRLIEHTLAVAQSVLVDETLQ